MNDYKDINIEQICKHLLNSYTIDNDFIYQVYEEFYQLACFLYSFKPHNILEIGTRGSTFALFNKLATGQKIAVDLNEDVLKSIYFLTLEKNCHFINGNSQNIEIFNKIQTIAPKFDFIFIDGDHSYEGVKADFNLYKTLLSDRGYIGFHDIDPNHFLLKTYAEGEAKTGKVRRFWEELNYGSKIEIICQKSNSGNYFAGDKNIKDHFGGIGLWKP